MNCCLFVLQNIPLAEAVNMALADEQAQGIVVLYSLIFSLTHEYSCIIIIYLNPTPIFSLTEDNFVPDTQPRTGSNM